MIDGLSPEAVVSGSVVGYGAPLGLAGPGRFRVWWRKLLRRKPISQRFLLRIGYRSGQTRIETVHFEQPKVSIKDFADKLLAAPNVRSVEVAELLVKGRKSFASDYDPANWGDVLATLSPSPEGSNPHE